MAPQPPLLQPGGLRFRKKFHTKYATASSTRARAMMDWSVEDIGLITTKHTKDTKGLK